MEKIKILHVLHNIGSGGVEQRRLLLSNYLDTDKYGQKIVCSFARDPLLSAIKQNNMDVITIGQFKSIFDFKQYRKVIKMINEFKPDIIHGAVFEGVIMACVCGFIKKVPIIIAEETSDPHDRSQRADFLLRCLCLAANKVVAISQGTAEYLHNRAKIPLRKIQLINNGVDLPRPVNDEEINRLRKYLGIQTSDFIIGSVGRLQNEVKKFTDIIKAIALLKKYSQLKLLIVGDGNDKELILQAARQLNISEKLIMTGYQADTSPYYELMDVFCLASQREGFGLVAAEAMFHHLPVIATNVGGLKYVVQDNITGLLVPPNNPQAIAEKLEILIEDAELRKSLGNAGYECAKQEYSAEVYVGKVDKMYQELYRNKVLHQE